MTYVIAEPCVNTKDTACVEVCPVDCIHPRRTRRSSRPRPSSTSTPRPASTAAPACPVCPVQAIFPAEEVPEKWDALHADGSRLVRQEEVGRPVTRPSQRRPQRRNRCCTVRPHRDGHAAEGGRREAPGRHRREQRVVEHRARRLDDRHVDHVRPSRHPDLHHRRALEPALARGLGIGRASRPRQPARAAPRRARRARTGRGAAAARRAHGAGSVKLSDLQRLLAASPPPRPRRARGPSASMRTTWRPKVTSTPASGVVPTRLAVERRPARPAGRCRGAGRPRAWPRDAAGKRTVACGGGEGSATVAVGAIMVVPTVRSAAGGRGPAAMSQVEHRLRRRVAGRARSPWRAG